MTILKTTLLAAIALLLAVQVPAKDPDITILKVKPVQPQMHILPPPEYDPPVMLRNTVASSDPVIRSMMPCTDHSVPGGLTVVPLNEIELALT